MIMKGFAPENGAKPFAIMKTQGPGGRQPARSWHRTGTVGRGNPARRASTRPPAPVTASACFSSLRSSLATAFSRGTSARNRPFRAFSRRPPRVIPPPVPKRTSPWDTKPEQSHQQDVPTSRRTRRNTRLPAASHYDGL